MATDKQLYELSTEGLSHAEIAQRYQLRVDSVRGRISRYTQSLSSSREYLQARVVQLEEQLETLHREREASPAHTLGTPWKLDGDWVVVGDVHANTINQGFMLRPLQIAEMYLSHPRRLMVAGDFINADAWSNYDPIAPTASFAQELAGARAFFEAYLKVFDEIYITLGNHDRRIQKRTKLAIEPQDLLRMISHDTRIQISWWGHAVIGTEQGEYRVTHGSEYSVQQLNVADQLAQKYKQHIIGHHQHHLAKGWDRFKNHVVIDNGGLFDETAMAYATLDDNKRPRMANGFTMLLNGTPYLFGKKPYTDWSFWLNPDAHQPIARDI